MVDIPLEGLAWGLMALFMGLSGVLVLKNQILKLQIKNLDVDDVVKRLKLKEQYVTDLEDEIDGYRKDLDDIKKESVSWQGKYHQKGQIKKLPADKYDLSKKSDIGIVAEDVLNQIEDSLSPDLQQIIKDPSIRSKILEYANEHPDETVEYVKRFLSQKGSSQQSSIIPNFDSKNAI